MKLRFRVNQAECLKRGIDAPKSIVTIEVNPAELPIDTRTIIARHMMDGIDVCELDKHGEKLFWTQTESEMARGESRVVLIEANEPTLDGLIETLKKNSPVEKVKKEPHTRQQNHTRRENAGSGAHLNELWKIGARQARFNQAGKFYMPLSQFPGALCDPNGYVLFKTEDEYRNCPFLGIGVRLSVSKGISSIPSYVRKSAML